MVEVWNFANISNKIVKAWKSLNKRAVIDGALLVLAMFLVVAFTTSLLSRAITCGHVLSQRALLIRQTILWLQITINRHHFLLRISHMLITLGMCCFQKLKIHYLLLYIRVRTKIFNNNFPHYGVIFMPWCACTNEVYSSLLCVCVCVCVCVSCPSVTGIFASRVKFKFWYIMLLCV